MAVRTMLAVACVAAATAVQADRGQLTFVHRFSLDEGWLFSAPLMQASDGNFYGTATLGGTRGNGTVFQATPSGAVIVLHQFDGIDGSAPLAGLMQAADGTLYGSTQYGGPLGFGNLFSLSPSLVLSDFYDFSGTSLSQPLGQLIQGADGNFYGVTGAGGVSGAGTVFRLTPTGVLTTLHSFNGADGLTPLGGLVQGPDGALYGVTALGGASNAGTVFCITPDGSFATLHSFDYADGFVPQGPLVFGTDGNLYGTTQEGYNLNLDYGTVYRISPGGSFTQIHAFSAGDGGEAGGRLVLGADGNFYGLTQGGGAYNYGTVYQITPAGVVTYLHSFANTDGYPVGGLLLAADGNFYGLTSMPSSQVSSTGGLFRVTVSAGIPTPVFSVASGVHLAPMKAPIWEGVADAVVHYTVDGSNPTLQSPVYSAPLSIGKNVTLKVIAFKGQARSAMATAAYSMMAGKPAFGGRRNPDGSLLVRIDDSTTDATIHYTTDGSRPTESSPVYSTPLVLTASTTVSAIAYAPGNLPSPTTTYTFNVQ